MPRSHPLEKPPSLSPRRVGRVYREPTQLVTPTEAAQTLGRACSASSVCVALGKSLRLSEPPFPVREVGMRARSQGCRGPKTAVFLKPGAAGTQISQRQRTISSTHLHGHSCCNTQQFSAKRCLPPSALASC